MVLHFLEFFPRPHFGVVVRGSANYHMCLILFQQKLKEVPKVLLSSMSPQERIFYSAIVEELGGEVCSSQGFSPCCTHVIVGTPIRSEKYLSAIAAGKWVLHTSYLETSQKEGGFVEVCRVLNNYLICMM